MNKQAAAFIFATILGINVFAQNSSQITGVVTSVNGSTVNFRTATENLQINLDNVPANVRQQLQQPNARRSIASYNVGGSGITSRSQVPFGIRADCSELPISANELTAIARRSRNMQEFLDSIPAGTLQGFTFVPNTQSLHRGRAANSRAPGVVNPNWPRVLRGSIDGKMTVSFVCDPQNETYGRVEIIHFNEQQNRFETLEFDFGHPTRPVSGAPRVTQNPQQCVSCHEASRTSNGQPRLKLNWPEYFFWGDCDRSRGISFYGSSDDNMGSTFRSRFPTTAGKNPQGCNDSRDRQAFEQDKQDYRNFRQRQSNNACFNSLPWPQGSQQQLQNSDPTRDYSVYPYSQDAQQLNSATNTQNYSLRTNTRFTDAYSHLTALRNFQILKDSPEYNQAKYFIAMEEAGCITDRDRAEMRRLLPGFDTTATNTPGLNPNFNGRIDYDPRADRPLLYNYGRRAGMNDADWTMEFRDSSRPLDPVYNAVMFRSSVNGQRFDAQIHHVVGAEVIRDIARTNSDVRSATQGAFDRGATELFGQQFSCIDDLGHAVRLDRRGNTAICNALRRAKDGDRIAASTCTDCQQNSAGPLNPVANQVRQNQALIDQIEQNMTAAQVERGRQLVRPEGRGKCNMCHSPQAGMATDFHFVPMAEDPQSAEGLAVLRARLQEGDLLDRIHTRLVQTRTMPPEGVADDLTDQDRQDIRAYLYSLGTGRTQLQPGN